MKHRARQFKKQLVALKRFIVLAPALLLFALSFFVLFPSLNKRLPASIAVVIVYIATAYITIPLLYRLYRVMRPPTHLPRYSVTPDGFACDPVNIAIAGTRQELMKVMTDAGWHKADSRNVRSLTKLALSVLMRRQYRNAPFSTLYLFGRGQDLGFQKPIDGEKGAHKRHHVRFWACVPALLEGMHEKHADFWDKLYPNIDRGEVLWVGCASRDIGIIPIRHNFQLTHRVHENTDTERDIIVDDLRSTNYVESVRFIKSGEPISVKNRALSSRLTSDGTLAVVDLK